MTFMDKTVKENIPIWDKCAETPFVRELREGILPAEKFRRYMIQDSIYLKHYARVCGMAVCLSTDPGDIQIWHSLLRQVTEEESLVRLSYLKKYGLTDEDAGKMKPLPENQRYIDFLTDIAGHRDTAEILMSVLPCMLSYSYIFRKTAKRREAPASQYFDFIQDYAEDGYFRECRDLCDFAEEKCRGLPEAKQKKLGGIFRQASLLELEFWKMAYGNSVQKKEE